MVKIIYMVLGMKCISAYEKNDIFGVRVVITIFLHLISNTSYFVKKCTCKILGWLIYVLYEKKIDLCSSWLLSVEDGWIRIGSWTSKRWTIFTRASIFTTPNNILNVLSNKFYSHWKIKYYKNTLRSICSENFCQIEPVNMLFFRNMN